MVVVAPVELVAMTLTTGAEESDSMFGDNVKVGAGWLPFVELKLGDG